MREKDEFSISPERALEFFKSLSSQKNEIDSKDLEKVLKISAEYLTRFMKDD